MDRLTAVVLGSAAGGGFPQWNCRCPACELAWAGDPRVQPRTQASLAVSAGNGRWTLINASPDLRQQIWTTPVLHPRGGVRGSAIAAVVLTGGEIDQVAGLLSLREGTPFALYATGETHAAVAANAMFGAMRAMTCRTVALRQAFAPTEGLTAELFSVPGKAPLYLEDDNQVLDDESGANAGVELSAGGRRLVFVPGAAAVSPEVRERLMRADAVLFDGTLYTDDEMRRLGVGQKSGRRMGHMPIDGDGGSLAALQDIESRKIYVHINNTNPILIAGSPERARVRAAGWEIAEDGTEIVL